MNKITSLHNHILGNPDLMILPGDLLSFASGMQIVSIPAGSNEHFEIQYTANLVITNYSAPFDRLAYWLLLWLKINQPNHSDGTVSFGADILGGTTKDISLAIALSETFQVEHTAEGTLLHHTDEPFIEPTLLTAPQWRAYANSEARTEWVVGS